MNHARQWATLGLGALTLTAATFALSTRSFAQGAGRPRRDPEVRRQDRPEIVPGQAPPGAPGGLPGGGFGGGGVGGFPGDPFSGGPPMMPMMGGTQMTATSSTVFVLRGNTLYAFDAGTLRLKAKTQLPAPEPPGPGDPGGGFGESGLGGFGQFGGDRRF